MRPFLLFLSSRTYSFEGTRFALLVPFSFSSGGNKLILVLVQSQSGVADKSDSRGNRSIDYFNFASSIQDVSVDSNSVRALVTVSGIHKATDGGVHEDWLPFILRFYLYADSDSIRLVHVRVFPFCSAQFPREREGEPTLLKHLFEYLCKSFSKHFKAKLVNFDATSELLRHPLKTCANIS